MIKNNNIPAHVGVIMDGNGRWAALRGKKRSFGHEAGAKNAEVVVDELFLSGVKVVSYTLFQPRTSNATKKKSTNL